MTLISAARAVSIGDFARTTRQQLEDDFRFDEFFVELQRAGRRVVNGARDGVPSETMWWFLDLYIDRLYVAFGARTFDLLTPGQTESLMNALYATRIMLEAALSKYAYLPHLARLYRDAYTTEVLPDAQNVLWIDAYLRKVPAETPVRTFDRPSGIFRV